MATMPSKDSSRHPYLHEAVMNAGDRNKRPRTESNASLLPPLTVSGIQPVAASHESLRGAHVQPHTDSREKDISKQSPATATATATVMLKAREVLILSHFPFEILSEYALEFEAAREAKKGTENEAVRDASEKSHDRKSQIDEETLLELFSMFFSNESQMECLSEERQEREKVYKPSSSFSFTPIPKGIQMYPRHRTVILLFKDDSETQGALFFCNGKNVWDLVEALARVVGCSEIHSTPVMFENSPETKEHTTSQGSSRDAADVATACIDCNREKLRRPLFARILPNYIMREAIPPLERFVIIISHPRLLWARCVLPRLEGFVSASLSIERVPALIRELYLATRQQSDKELGHLFDVEDEILAVYFLTAELAEKALITIRRTQLARILV